MTRHAEWHAILALIIFLSLFLSAGLTHAQFDSGVDLALELSPSHPSPGEVVRVTVHSQLLDLSGTTLVWYENGKKVAEGTGISEVNVTAGSLGSETNLAVKVTENGIERAIARARIHPTEVDLLWESDSYAPPFFRGRALPSAGTNLRLETIPRFKRSNGSFVPIRDITFTWRKNGYVVASASGRGKSQAYLPSPPLFGTDTISVEAWTSDGFFEGVASVRVPSTEPVLKLYENHPLFGVMYHQALGNHSFLPEIEMSFAAVPYFAETANPNDGSLLYEWRVNGNVITNDVSRPSEITINARGSSGIALVELAISHATNFFLSASGSWRMTLLGKGGAGLENPFTGTQ